MCISECPKLLAINDDGEDAFISFLITFQHHHLPEPPPQSQGLQILIAVAR
jgi:hypothetical protein